MKKLLLSLFVLLFLASCNEEENIPSSTGNVLVINEGNFGSANATIGIYNTGDSTYNPNAFRSQNGYFIGDVLQSIAVVKETAYGILNGSNTIEVFNAKSFESMETLEDAKLDKPRYMTISNSGDIAYVSVWGPYTADYSLTNSKVLVIDLNNMEVIDSVATEPGVEQIARSENTLLVTRNFYGSYNHLSFINISDLSVTADIELPQGPDEIILDEAGNVWVSCTSGAIVKIDVENQKIAQNIDLNGSILGDVAFYEDELYFLQDGKVNSINLTTEVITNRVNNISIEIPYALAVNPFNGDVYLGDGVSYGSEGKVFHYDVSGALVSEFNVGIFPSQFIFK